MHSKRYGKLTVGAWLSLEMERSNPIAMLLLGGLLLAACIFIRFACGSPYPLLHAMGIESALPPVWILNLLRALSFFLIGCGFGFALFYRDPSKREEKYKGGFLFLLFVLLELIWYPTLFIGGFLFICVLERILILCLAVGTTHCFYRLSKFAGMLFFLHCLWLIYLLFLSFFMLFCV